MSNTAFDGTKGPVPVNGITPDDPAKPPVRLELRDLHQNYPDQWNLYLLGLEAFKLQNEQLPLSFYKIAGIHGLPFERWPEQSWNRMEQVNRGKQFGGFCTHSSILFLPWHRPYLALFEAELYKHVNEIANLYGADEGGVKYIEAAKYFRMPYWDWALPSDDIGLFPAEVLSGTKHQVIRPKKAKQDPVTKKDRPTEINPLASYQFGDFGSKNHNINRFADAGSTLRYPVQVRGDTKRSSDDENLRKRFITLYKDKDIPDDQRAYKKGKNLTERVLYLLESYPIFKPISNNRLADSTWENWGSLEDIHNSIHGYIGGGGQMSDPSVAAFDPIFWLHHTNIDRLFAIWQALYDDPQNASTYVESAEAGWGGFTTKVGDTEDLDTKLTPFNASEDVKDFWTSETVRTTTTFGYVYPETRDWVFPTTDDVRKELERIYPSGSLANIMKSSKQVFDKTVNNLKGLAVSHLEVAKTALDTATIIKTAQVLPESIAAEADKIQLPAGRAVKDLVKDNKYLEWLVDVKAEKHTQDGDFMVHFFLGEPEDDNPYVYIANPAHVASFSTFGQDANTSCEKCQEAQARHMQVTGQIPLTMALVERYLAGQVDGLSVEPVTDFLQKNLHWRVTRRDGERFGRAEVENLLVGVVTNEVTLPTSPGGRPQYSSNVVPRPEITTNREGQARGKGTGYTGGSVAVT